MAGPRFRLITRTVSHGAIPFICDQNMAFRQLLFPIIGRKWANKRSKQLIYSIKKILNVKMRMIRQIMFANYTNGFARLASSRVLIMLLTRGGEWSFKNVPMVSQNFRRISQVSQSRFLAVMCVSQSRFFSQSCLAVSIFFKAEKVFLVPICLNYFCW